MVHQPNGKRSAWSSWVVSLPRQWVRWAAASQKWSRVQTEHKNMAVQGVNGPRKIPERPREVPKSD